MNPLKIGVDGRGRIFALPLELVTQTIAILARKGKGKSYLAAIFAEELLEVGEIPIVIDPTGAHWGLKASADGTKAGYPIVVFGGEHADVPLEETAGELIARAIVEHRFPAILDVSMLRKGASHRFLAAFLETLYRLNRHPLHLICDEADDYAPQRPFGDEARVLGAMEDIVRRGRIKGIGCTLVTQRPQVINKNVLTQTEMLVTMNMGHPKDIGAIQEWVAVHGDEEKAKTMISSLPALERGVAWFWAPGWGDLFEKVTVRLRRTFNSGATPKPGERIEAPKQLAAVDVAKLGKEIAATAQRAKDNDPGELKRQISQLRADLLKKPSAVTAPAQRIEVPILDEKTTNLIRCGIGEIGLMRGEIAKLDAQAEKLVREFNALAGNVARSAAAKPPKPTHRPVYIPNVKEKSARPSRESRAPANGEIGKCELAILRVLAQFPEGCEIGKIALLSGYRVSGGFRNSLSALRTIGAIEGENTGIMRLTEDGHGHGPFEPLPQGDALRQYWLTNRSFGKCERAILAALIENYPQTIEELAKSCEPPYEVSGGFRNSLSALRTAGVITGRNTGPMQPSDELLNA